jgi:RNA polymerase sigma-70 factor (ECF subfamily)
MTGTMSAFVLAFEAVLLPWRPVFACVVPDDDERGCDGREPNDNRAPATASAPAEPDPDLETFWRGDGAALEAIYRAHARRLLGTARAVVGPAEAESVVHETFVELIRNQELRRRFTGGSLAAWLGAIARHKSLEYLRRRDHRPRTDVDRSDDASAADVAGERADLSPEPRLEARDLLMRFLKVGVPAAQIDFFRRRFLDGQTQLQVAAALGMPRSTLEGWEHRLSEKLRRFIWENTR